MLLLFVPLIETNSHPLTLTGNPHLSYIRVGSQRTARIGRSRDPAAVIAHGRHGRFFEEVFPGNVRHGAPDKHVVLRWLNLFFIFFSFFVGGRKFLGCSGVSTGTVRDRQ